MNLEARPPGYLQTTAEQITMLGQDATGTELLNAFATPTPREISTLVTRIEAAIAQDNAQTVFTEAVGAAISAPARQDVRACLETVVFAEPDREAEIQTTLREFLHGPDEPARCLNLGAALRREQYGEEAALAFQRGLNAGPDEGECWRSLAAVMRDAGHFDAALALALHFVRENPEDAWAHVQHANILARLDRPRDAIDVYRQAIALEPNAAGVQTAIARQYVSLGDFLGAKTEYHGAIHNNPEDDRALEGLADTLSELGRHAEAVMWYRRAHTRRPKSRTITGKLAAALWLRQHWSAGRALLFEPTTNTETQDTPRWQGQRTRDGWLAVCHDPKETPQETMIGLGMARHIAITGQPVLCLCPASLIDRVSAPPEKLKLVAFDSDEAAALMQNDDIAARVSFADIAAFGEWAATPLDPWFVATKTAPTSRANRIAYISGETAPRPGPDLDQIRARVSDQSETRAVYMKARSGIEKSLAAMKNLSFIVTDDPLTGLLTAATGCPSAVLLPANCPWWWRDHGEVSPWAANQTLLRCMSGTDATSMDEPVIRAVEAGGIPQPQERSIRPSSGPPELTEMLDRLTPLLEPHESRLVTAKPMTGGTRNQVFHLRCETGDRVIRLGRFPAPRRGFYVKENNNMRIAARAGLSPRVDFADGLDGSMMLELIDGKTMRSADLRKQDNAEAVGRIFRKLHQLPGFKDSFDILTKVERNTARLHRRALQAFTEQQSFNDLMVRIIGILRGHGVPHYATHNDPLTRNFIRRDDVMMLIDWECSGLGDPHWEVAAMSAQAGLDRDVWEAYMVAYFGSAAHPGICRIPLFEAVCRYFWWTDALCTGIDEPDDPSWQDKAKRWWGWFTDVVGASSFEGHMHDAEHYRWEPSHSPGSPDYDD